MRFPFHPLARSPRAVPSTTLRAPDSRTHLTTTARPTGFPLFQAFAGVKDLAAKDVSEFTEADVRI